MFFVVFGFLALMWWQSRSQQKKQAAAIAALKKGDRITTSSGLVGRLLEKDDRYAKIEIAPGVKIQVLVSSLTGRDADPSTAATTKEKEDAK